MSLSDFPITKTVNGVKYTVRAEWDTFQPSPWDVEDGHGPVEVRRVRENFHGFIPKARGERILFQGRLEAAFYDFAKAVKIAKRDGWNSCKTKAEAAEAAEQDFRRLKAFCDGDWGYVLLIVDAERNGWKRPTVFCVGGFESDDPNLSDLVGDLIAEAAAELEDAA